MGQELSLLWVLPFVGILLSIGLFPLFAPHFWHHHYQKVALGWALLLAVPFLLAHGSAAFHEIVHIYLLDYVPFIILLGSLYIVAGGILVRGTLVGTPWVNAVIILVGTGLASIIGTTGASMLLIRPLLRANEHRTRKVHTVVFFIFLVSNIGGSLTPLGDPPLFLGFLHSVPFFWTLQNLWPAFLLAVAILIVIYLLLDWLFYLRDAAKLKLQTNVDERVPLSLQGKGNLLLLAGILGGVLLSGYWKPAHMSFEPLRIHDGVLQVMGGGGHADTHSAATEHDGVQEHSPSEAAKAEQQVAGHADEDQSPNKAAAHASAEPGSAHVDPGEHGSADQDHSPADAGHGHHAGIGIPVQNVARDLILIVMAVLSMVFTPRAIREGNGFTWFPITEVAALFAGIFMTIIPALLILKAGENGALAGLIRAVDQPIHYFWVTGILSSFLDNAPTYLTFLNTALGRFSPGQPETQAVAALIAEQNKYLVAISLGAVFMGANTYIGNAPNFMVRSIAEENGVRMPDFFPICSSILRS